jgi:pimeloyl-ACP methyl ester carboxylesterase
LPVLNLGDTDIYYEIAGKGPSFLFNAATAWHGEAWKLYQVPEFSNDHTVITYDQRGTGKSKTKGDDFSTKRLAQDVAALLDHLNLKSTIALGHSNGGRIATTLTTEYPGLVNKLILASSGTTYKGPPGIPLKMCVELVEKGYEKYTLDHVFNVGFTKAHYEANKEICDRFIAVRMSNLVPLETFLGHVIGRQASDTTSKLKDIKVPTLVMIGEDEDHHATDLSHLQSAKLLAAQIPGAKFVMLPGQGHHYPFVAPETTNKTIREFLAEP